MLDPKKPLNITVAEPVVFLRSSDPAGRHQSDHADPPALVRGIVTLDVTKPIGISSIDVELKGVLSMSYPEAIGSRRVDIPERHKIYSSTVTVFRADQVPRTRLSASVGPGLSSVNHDWDQRTATFPSRLPSLPRGRSERRSITCLALDLGPTPPYSAVQSPQIQPILGVYEDPAQTLEALRRSLRENSQAQAGFASPSYRSSIASSPPNSMMHSLSSSDGSLHRVSDNHTDDVVGTHTCSRSESFHNIADHVAHMHFQGPSSDSTRAHSPESPDGPHPRAHGSSLEASSIQTSRSRLRRSINSVLDAVKEITSRAPSRSRSTAASEERERGRPRVRATTGEQSVGSNLEFSGGVNTGDPGSVTQTDHPEPHLLGLGRVFGLERDHERNKEDELKSKGESWREFKPGTYSYPISFLLPPHLPPTFNLPNGSLSYTIKGVAHRPGTFTFKLSCEVPLMVVSAPAVGVGEDGAAGDPGPIIFQKQWQTNLAYSFGLSSRLFLLGSERHLGGAADHESLVVGVEGTPEAVYGTATLDLNLLPIEKVKIWKLELIVDQRVRYTDERGRLCRDDDVKQVKLLAVQDTCSVEEMDAMDEVEHARKNKHKQKNAPIRIPLLPTPLSPHRSPLLRYLAPSSDPSVLAGPGPYTLSTVIGLPGCESSLGDSGPLNFTLKHKSSSVKVEHFIRLVMRVESIGEEDAHRAEECDQKRMFDITVQTPINILSCRCVPEQQTLPRYSKFTEDGSQHRVACPCRPLPVVMEQEYECDGGGDSGHLTTPSPTSSFDNVHRAADGHLSSENRSRSSSRTGNDPAGPLSGLRLSSPVRRAGWNDVVQSPPQSHAAHTHTDSASHMRTRSQTPSFSTPHPSRPPSPLARYARLVSGLESEAGEAPPSYESVASGP